MGQRARGEEKKTAASPSQGWQLQTSFILSLRPASNLVAFHRSERFPYARQCRIRKWKEAGESADKGKLQTWRDGWGSQKKGQTCWIWRQGNKEQRLRIRKRSKLPARLSVRSNTRRQWAKMLQAKQKKVLCFCSARTVWRHRGGLKRQHFRH